MSRGYRLQLRVSCNARYIQEYTFIYKTSTRPSAHDYSVTEKCSLHASQGSACVRNMLYIIILIPLTDLIKSLYECNVVHYLIKTCTLIKIALIKMAPVRRTHYLPISFWLSTRCFPCRLIIIVECCSVSCVLQWNQVTRRCPRMTSKKTSSILPATTVCYAELCNIRHSLRETGIDLHSAAAVFSLQVTEHQRELS